MLDDTSGRGRGERSPRVPTSTPGIYKRGDSYGFRFTDPLTGKKRSSTHRTKAAATKARARTLAAIADGEYRSPTNTTFADYAREWIAGYTGTGSKGIRPATKSEYERDIRRAIAFYGESVKLASVDAASVRRYAKHLGTGSKTDGRGLSTATRKRVMVPLRLCLEQAASDGVIRSNPAKGLRLGASPADAARGEQDHRDKALTPDEYTALLAELEDEKYPAQMGLLAKTIGTTGLRIGEALALTWADVGTDAVRVSRSLRGRVVGDTKSVASRRTVPLPPGTRKALAAHRVASPNSGDADLVFCRLDGSPLGAQNLTTQHLRPALDAVGVTRPGTGWHSLRHLYATRLLVAGQPVSVVSALLGHSDNGATVMRVYSHVLTSDLPSGAAIAAALGGATG